MRPVDGVLAAPALADDLPAGGGVVRGYGVRERRAQVEIPPDTLRVGTFKAEQGLAMRQVEGVFDCASFGEPFGVHVGQFHRQRLQALERIRQTRGVLDALALLLAAGDDTFRA